MSRKLEEFNELNVKKLQQKERKEEEAKRVKQFNADQQEKKRRMDNDYDEFWNAITQGKEFYAALNDDDDEF